MRSNQKSSMRLLLAFSLLKLQCFVKPVANNPGCFPGMGTHPVVTAIDLNEFLLDIREPIIQISYVGGGHQLRGGKYIFRETKSKHSRRQIALSPSLAIVLWEYRLKQEHARSLLGKSLEPTDLVFSHPDGRPIRPDSVTRAFHAEPSRLD